jgi:hypothetical protein
MASEKSIEELIARSSLGTVGAQAVRERADPEAVAQVLRRAKEIKLAEDTLAWANHYDGELEVKAQDKKGNHIAYSKASPGETIEYVRARTWVK